VTLLYWEREDSILLKQMSFCIGVLSADEPFYFGAVVSKSRNIMKAIELVKKNTELAEIVKRD